MGGNAIKNNNGDSICGRLELSGYKIFKEYIISILSKYCKCQTVRELPYKTSFGDIDIICVNNPELNIMNIIKEEFKVMSNHIVINGCVISFAFSCSLININTIEYFQVDIMLVDSLDDLEMSDFYLSYSDIGSIIGRITYYYSLKFGHKGLWCHFYESSINKYLNKNTDDSFDVRHNIGKIYLCNNPKQICEYLDLDYNVWLNEFPYLKENEDYKIYDWIIKSKFYKQEIFFTLNHFHNKRKNFRPFYRNFIKYINVENIVRTTKDHGETGGVQFDKQMEAIKYFNKETDVEQLIHDYNLVKIRNAKFNALDLLNKFDNIDNPRKSKLLLEFKNYCMQTTKSESFENFLDNYNREDILNFVKCFKTIDFLNNT